ncbi:TPA: tetratricopeptide repeat protein [Candidatus Poribacteria bacterium]|nr:tetratricopeptide repeat protein [Candidatus Poribacteria bacterium]
MKKVSREQAIQIAKECYQSKQYRQVTQILQRLIQYGVQDDDIYLLMGHAYYCLGQYQQAIQAYLNGIQIADSAVCHANLGDAHVQQGCYNDAIDSYSKATAINPDFPAVHLNLIYAYSVAQQTENAIRMCGQVLSNKCDSNSLEVALESEYTRNSPSPNYLSLIGLYNKLHVDGDLNSKEEAKEVYAGRSIMHWINPIKNLIALTDSQDLLDSGSGKGFQYQNLSLEGDDQIRYQSLQDYWKVDEIYCYDPTYPPHQKFPQKRYDIVISTDVLEHCHQEDIKWIIDEIFGLAKKCVFATIACFVAQRLLPNGENAHCTIRPGVWWNKILQSVTPNYPDVKYWFLVEYLYLDIVGEKRVFQTLSNFNHVEGILKLST